MTTPSRDSAQPSTAERILDSAERLVQLRGFNGFSYADIAAELGVTKASLHYHYPGKAELGEALIVRYAGRFARALEVVDTRSTDAVEKLTAYANLYGDVLRGRRMCLCGMLAAEFETLPEPMRRAVVGFFDESEKWLEAVLDDGRRRGALAFTGAARETARTLLGSLEGAMLVSRPYDDVSRFEDAAERLVAGLTAAPARAD